MGYSKKHYQRLANWSPTTKKQRIAHQKSGELAHADALGRFGQTTIENAADFITYQQERCEYHYNQLMRDEPCKTL